MITTAWKQYSNLFNQCLSICIVQYCIIYVWANKNVNNKNNLGNTKLFKTGYFQNLDHIYKVSRSKYLVIRVLSFEEKGIYFIILINGPHILLKEFIVGAVWEIIPPLSLHRNTNHSTVLLILFLCKFLSPKRQTNAIEKKLTRQLLIISNKLFFNYISLIFRTTIKFLCLNQSKFRVLFQRKTFQQTKTPTKHYTKKKLSKR